jgi:hypothetical protein
MPAPTRKWIKMSEVYMFFASDYPRLDFSRQAAQEMFESESSGKTLDDWQTNGYAVGKHWMDVTVGQWRKDMADRIVSIQELRKEESRKPIRWWMDRVFPV